MNYKKLQDLVDKILPNQKLFVAVRFLNDERSAGGHILELETLPGTCQLDILNTFTLVLPSESGSLAEIDLGKDRSHALEKVER